MFGLNPWGFTSILAAVVSVSFAYFLWTKATPTPVTRRFIVLLLAEIVTVLTSEGGILRLFNHNLSPEIMSVLDVLHHLGDVLMLTLYPIFVAYALPIRFLKPLTARTGRFTLYTIGFIAFVLLILIHFKVIETNVNSAFLLYQAMIIMFLAVFVLSVVSAKGANTKLAKEKAIAFVLAFGFRDLAWAALYLSVVTGWIEVAPMVFDQLYVGSTLVYIPIMTYGILKLQMLDIEIRLKTTIRGSVLAGAFVALFYLISEGANTLMSNQLGGLIGFAASALLTIFLTPLHNWADRFSAKLVGTDIEKPDYAATRGLQIYSAAVEETLAFGEISKGHIALLDRLKDSLNLSDNDAARLELDLDFNRAAAG